MIHRRAVPLATRYEFNDAGAGTLVRVRNSGGAGLIFRIAKPLFIWVLRRQVAADLRRLKRTLERTRPVSAT